MDIKSVNNLLEFLEKVFNGGSGERRVVRERRARVKAVLQHIIVVVMPQLGLHPPMAFALAPPRLGLTLASPWPHLGLTLASPWPPACPSPPLHSPPLPADFNTPVQRCLDRLTNSKWANSDILLVSDGELRQPGPEIMRKLSGAKDKLGWVPGCMCGCLCGCLPERLHG